MRRTILAVSLLLAPPALAQPAAPRVGTMPVALKGVAQGAEFVGRVDAIDKVQLHARITGTLEEVSFKEGDAIAAGAPLYKIDRAPFEAALQQAQGAVLLAQATYANASAQRARTQELVRTNAAPAAQLDTRIADEKNAQGNLISADAALKQAQINLSYADITAPVAGVIGRSAVTRGNIVGPDSGILATIVSEDPIRVTFPVSQRFLLTLDRTRLQNAGDKAVVRLRFADGTEYPQTGRIDFVDNIVDRATDTVLVRAQFANPNRILVDGQLVRVRVAAAQTQDQVVVPQAAILADQQGAYVFTVVDGKATVTRIRLGAAEGTDVVVQDGLKGGEQLIVVGIESLRPGIAVTPVPVIPGTTATGG